MDKHFIEQEGFILNDTLVGINEESNILENTEDLNLSIEFTGAKNMKCFSMKIDNETLVSPNNTNSENLADDWYQIISNWISPSALISNDTTLVNFVDDKILSSGLDELEELIELKIKGTLTDDEFEHKKHQIFNINS